MMLGEIHKGTLGLMAETDRLRAARDELRAEVTSLRETCVQLKIDAKRYLFLRNDEETFAVMTPRRSGHIAYYGRALDELIDAAMAADGTQREMGTIPKARPVCPVTHKECSAAEPCHAPACELAVL